jgi:threonine aldolase
LGRNFSSDHVTPASDAIMAAVAAANVGSAASYGADELTINLQSVASALFEAEVAIFPVISGTAANALALSQIVQPFGAIYCHAAAHLITDEAGAPGFFSGGAQLMGLPSADGKIRPEQLGAAVAFAQELGVHHVKPGALSVTQSTEWGTVYSLNELSAITDVARRHGIPVHMDGARFANALAHLDCAPAEATWKRGVDVLSLGATKNGALCADAVVLFDTRQAEDFERRRKRGGHLLSKLRFLSAQLLAYFEQELWLKNARHANAMATRLAQGLKAVKDARLLQPVEANELFVELPEQAVAALETQGFKFYRWPLNIAQTGVTIRLVTSYATPGADVDEFIAAAAAATAALRKP